MRKRTRIAVLGAAAVLTLSSAAAVAFPGLSYWHDASDLRNAGASGIYYSGGALDFNLTCGNCHIKGKNPQGLIGLTVTPTPAWQSVNNQKAYKPGQTYQITVDMTGEHLGKVGDNGNGMVITFEDAAGKRAGALTSDAPNNSQSPCLQMAPFPEPAAPATTFLYGDCHGILFVRRTDTTQWKFTWTAPGSGTGALTAYYGGVDGDHLESDSLDDDVVAGSIKLAEGN